MSLENGGISSIGFNAVAFFRGTQTPGAIEVSRLLSQLALGDGVYAPASCLLSIFLLFVFADSLRNRRILTGFQDSLSLIFAAAPEKSLNARMCHRHQFSRILMEF